MEQRFIIFLWLLFSALSAAAQNATNVRVRQEGETIVITYDLDKKANVRIWVATGQSNQYTELKAVTGSVGKDISAGVNKQIIWQPLKEQNEFVAQNVRFKVEAKSVQYYFSVSETKKVVFSPGNLQYTRSTRTWSFAEHQYDILGTENVTGGNESYDAIFGYSKSGNGLSDKIDLFGWSGRTGSAKWGISTSQSNSDYSGDFVDWGTNIGDGKTWYTLTCGEWSYLSQTRTNADNLIGVARINLNADCSKYVNGLILLPDNWACPAGIRFKSVFSNTYSVQNYANCQTFTLSDWQKLEAAGAVFLPASGYRYGSGVSHVQNFGYSWAATAYSSNDADFLFFYSSVVGTSFYDRYFGRAVRLVQDL